MRLVDDHPARFDLVREAQRLFVACGAQTHRAPGACQA
jgi:hypothetical protein